MSDDSIYLPVCWSLRARRQLGQFAPIYTWLYDETRYDTRRFQVYQGLTVHVNYSAIFCLQPAFCYCERLQNEKRRSTECELCSA